MPTANTKKTARITRSTGAKLVAAKPSDTEMLVEDTRLISDAQAERLARDIFTVTHMATDEADVVGHAVMRIIDILVDESDTEDRVVNALAFKTAIYRRTRNCCDSMDSFAEGSRPKAEVADINAE
jgi:hypothetical protein